MFTLAYLLSCFFFFKQKTAYELRISDWSSDVCSSDLGARAGDAARSSRDRAARGGGRRVDGRDAGAVVGGDLPGTRRRQRRDRRHRATFGAEHRLSRGRAAGRDGRSPLARRRLFLCRFPRLGPRGRADGGAYHLSVGSRADRKSVVWGTSV